MGKTVVADTSGLISLRLSADQNHHQALQAVEEIKRQSLELVVPGEVVTEMVNVLGKKVNTEVAYTAGKALLIDRRYLINETTESMRLAALEKFKASASSVSLTDCLVMALADYYSTKLIFGFDAHFRKNGYLRLGID